ncbi:MAG: hypothetical protein WA210_18135 [Burkholderiaceae bacterium]
MTIDLADIAARHRAGLQLTNDEIDALLELAVPRLPFTQARALRRRLICEAIKRHFPLRPGERSWWSPSLAFHNALRAYAPGDWSAGEWGNDFGVLAACPVEHSPLQRAFWEILKSAPLDCRMPDTPQGFLSIMDDLEPIEVT